jgi:DNA-binding NarL/FixJ family response regulator
VADLLAISIKTVDRHCSNVMDKLGIHDRVELARFAIREGVIKA